MREFDAVIVGCGPAGNTAAYRLARAGATVLMIEKEHLPRHKVCGGGLSRKTLNELPFPVEPVIETRIAGAFIAYRGADAVFCPQEGIGAMVQRHAFDAFMTGKAVEAGATLWEGCSFVDFTSREGGVTVNTERGEVSTRVLIGADGVYSRVRKQMYPRARPLLVPAIEALVAPRAGSLDLLGNRCFFDLGTIPAGYAWIFPKRDHFNVGLYRFAKRKDNLAMKALLERFLDACPLFKGRGAVKIKALVIPVRAVAPRLTRGNVLLVGDAAGVGEAFYGEGIYYAVRSGNLAAAAVRRYLAAEGGVAAYDRAMRGLRRQLLASRLTATAFYLSPRLAFRHAVRNRAVNALFAGVIAGSVTPARCLVEFALLAPYWLAAPKMQTASVPFLEA
jgi:geranylgeranyl reductase family protein